MSSNHARQCRRHVPARVSQLPCALHMIALRVALVIGFGRVVILAALDCIVAGRMRVVRSGKGDKLRLSHRLREMFESVEQPSAKKPLFEGCAGRCCVTRKGRTASGKNRSAIFRLGHNLRAAEIALPRDLRRVNVTCAPQLWHCTSTRPPPSLKLVWKPCRYCS